jgi:hypothetical protein
MSDVNTDWRVRKLEIESEDYRGATGKYKGSVSFINGEFETISLKLGPDESQAFVDLIAERLTEHTSVLVERLRESFGLTTEEAISDEGTERTCAGV